MIQSPPIIEIFGVYDRGIPNLERIVLRVNGAIDLTQYFVFLGFRAPLNADLIIPMPDQFIWLGQTFIDTPGWVFIFTGGGKPGVSQEQNTKEPVHSLYWNKPQTCLGHQDIVPALAHFDHLIIGNKPNKSIGDLNAKKTTGGTKTLLEILAEGITK
jgi:hypothetical protein